MEQTCQVQNLIASLMQTEAGLLAWRSQGGTHGEDTVQNLIRCSDVDGGQASPEKSRGNPWPGRCVKVTRDNLPLTAGKGEVNNSRCPDSSMPRTRQASRMMARRNTRRYEDTIHFQRSGLHHSMGDLHHVYVLGLQLYPTGCIDQKQILCYNQRTMRRMHSNHLQKSMQL